MLQSTLALLPDRGVVSVTGPDALPLLDNLVTNDLQGMAPSDARFAALLTPQGKILFEFFVVATSAGFLLETALTNTGALAKRLGLYKLRAHVDIKDAAGEVVVAASMGSIRARPPAAIAFVDPRKPELGDRLLIPAPIVGETLTLMGKSAARVTVADYVARRIELGVPEGGTDYPLGDTFTHDANFDLLNGISFTKGCFVGQEVAARTQNKAVVRKRIVRVTSARPLATGDHIRAGKAVIGTIGSVAGSAALAIARLDRVAEAIDKTTPITVNEQPVEIEPAAIARYRESAAARAQESV